jgi:hypothetical protein
MPGWRTDLGSTLEGRYALAREVGGGLTGVTYLSSDLRLGEEVVVKVFDPALFAGPVRAQNLLRVQRARAYVHDHVVRLRDARFGEQFCYVTRDVAPGLSLPRWVDAEGLPTAPRALGLLQQIGAALRWIHQLGVHGALKPTNVFVDDKDRLGVTDPWWLAGQPTPDPWAAPEQTSAEAWVESRAADIFGLGMLLGFLLGGRRLDPRLSLAAQGVPVAEPLCACFAKATASDPAARFPDLDAFFGAVDPALTQATLPVVDLVDETGQTGALSLLEIRALLDRQGSSPAPAPAPLGDPLAVPAEDDPDEDEFGFGAGGLDVGANTVEEVELTGSSVEVIEDSREIPEPPVDVVELTESGFEVIGENSQDLTSEDARLLATSATLETVPDETTGSSVQVIEDSRQQVGIGKLAGPTAGSTRELEHPAKQPATRAGSPWDLGAARSPLGGTPAKPIEVIDGLILDFGEESQRSSPRPAAAALKPAIALDRLERSPEEDGVGDERVETRADLRAVGLRLELVAAAPGRVGSGVVRLPPPTLPRRPEPVRKNPMRIAGAAVVAVGAIAAVSFVITSLANRPPPQEKPSFPVAVVVNDVHASSSVDTQAAVDAKAAQAEPIDAGPSVAVAPRDAAELDARLDIQAAVGPDAAIVAVRQEAEATSAPSPEVVEGPRDAVAKPPAVLGDDPDRLKCPGGLQKIKKRKTVEVPEGDAATAWSVFCIDRHEYPGAGRPPRVDVGLEEARAACQARGHRLCSLGEWRSACGGKYPYGSSYDPERCNTVSAEGSPRPIAPSGTFPGCKSGFGTYDMVGNAAEWTEDGSVNGGSSTRDGESATCFRGSKRSGGGPHVGFRCCADAK